MHRTLPTCKAHPTPTQPAGAEVFLDKVITKAKQEYTEIAKANLTLPQQRAINANHTLTGANISLMQNGHNICYTVSFCLKQVACKLTNTSKHDSFATNHMVWVYHNDTVPAVLATLDSGVNGHYLSECNLQQANSAPPSTKRVGVANGGCSQAKHMTALPLPQLSLQAASADSFDNFPNSLISVGCLANNNTISIFTKDGVTVHREQGTLITCWGEPILIEVRDQHGRYRSHKFNTRDNGNPDPHKNASLPSYAKQTMCATCPPSNKAFNGCTQYAVTRSN